MHLSHSRLNLWWQLDWFLQSWIQIGISRCWPGWMRTSTDIESFIFTAWDLFYVKTWEQGVPPGAVTWKRRSSKARKVFWRAIISLSLSISGIPQLFRIARSPCWSRHLVPLWQDVWALVSLKFITPQDIYNCAPDQLRATAGGSGVSVGVQLTRAETSLPESTESNGMNGLREFECWALGVKTPAHKTNEWCAYFGRTGLSKQLIQTAT